MSYVIEAQKHFSKEVRGGLDSLLETVGTTSRSRAGTTRARFAKVAAHAPTCYREVVPTVSNSHF